jgi:hypothetical protein
MSGLENAVLPHLGAMLKGEKINLETSAQVSLAKWAVKTSMVAEHTLGRPASDLYWTPAERYSFSLPPHDIPGVTDVMLGHYEGSEWRALLTGGTTQIKQINSVVSVAPMIRSIIACQPVLLLVESDRYEETTGRKGWVWPVRHYERLVQLHRQMFRVISWPSPRPLSPDEFDELAGRDSPAGPAPLDVIDLRSASEGESRSTTDN